MYAVATPRALAAHIQYSHIMYMYIPLSLSL